MKDSEECDDMGFKLMLFLVSEVNSDKAFGEYNGGIDWR